MLENGDKAFLYTDGIIELKNQEGKQFGADRFYALLESMKDEPIVKIVQKVSESLKSYPTNFQDDISLLGFEKVVIN